ncbi:hypothetical protein JR316_0012410 [Psilocybe cubensis]|uniref:Uncharacterized protein n=1 Tax=Psilocybe cubensis TaxID=181762 RepID=A0ACB8GI71_PSICU|nr:hypothetical protein JR316_0012410 [Psilocybe cubensis]KAH9475299.1 hypothetical protein JR316_0012410 [Psilocybe cubensis]
MPTITAKDVVFHYTDSGLPTQCEEYSTLFVIHGHSFHSGKSGILWYSLGLNPLCLRLGIFSTLFPVASKESLRVICLDRREYQGSTPYTAEELRIIHEGTDAERLDLLTFEGVYLALGIEGLIRELDLPPGSGGGLVGWSMGNMFSLAVINAINHRAIPEDVRSRLKNLEGTQLLTYIADPPFQVLGLDSPPEYYSPLWDDDIPEGDRGSAFAHWISSYFNHDMEALAQRDPSKLNKRHPSSKKPTAERMTIDELVAVTDFRPGPKCDTAFGGPGYHTAQRLNYQNALFGAAPNSRNWHLRNVVHLYGVESAWSIIYTVWVLEDEDKTTKRIEFKAIQGVNHFMMWDEPEITVSVLKECMV